MTNRLGKMILLWVVLYGLFAMITAPHLYHLFLLNHRGKQTTGFTTGVAPHNIIKYEFEINGQTYEGASATGVGDVSRPNLADFRGPIVITYVPGKPQINSPGNIKALIRDQIEFDFLGAIFAAVVVLLIFLRQRLWPVRGTSGSCWILLAWFLASMATACDTSQSGAANTVRLDMTKLLGNQVRREGWEYVWLKPVVHVRDLPKAVRSRIGRKIADPGGAFNAGDIELPNSPPDRRLIFAGLSDKFCLIHYEYGGFGHGYMVAVFELSGRNAVQVWVHAGRRYVSLADFANEADPDELTNEVKDAIL